MLEGLCFSKQEFNFSATGQGPRLLQKPAQIDENSRFASNFSETNDLLAEDAVTCEPVSAKFPANREKYREVERIQPNNRVVAGVSSSLSFVYTIKRQSANRIEQGIVSSVSGSLFLRNRSRAATDSHCTTLAKRDDEDALTRATIALDSHYGG